MNKPQPDSRIEDYIKELSTPSVVSYSHITLHRLNKQYGCDLVSELLRNYFFAERAWYASRTRVASAGEATGCGDEVSNQA